MLKKILVGVGILLVGGFIWAKTDVGSYVKTAWKQCRGYVKASVPIDFEIKRAKDMLANLDKAEDRLISVMANEIVAIKSLEKETGLMEDNIKQRRTELQARNEEFKKTDKVAFVSSEGRYTRDQFGADLERRLKRLKDMENSLKAKKELLVQHNERLAAVRDQREGLKEQKKDLESRIQSLETQIELLKAAEARNKYRLDDSQLTELAKVKEIVDGLEKRIETSMTELQLRSETKADTKAPATFKTSGNLTQEIDSYLSGSESEVAGK
jgi:septation ring formation regulator EzrA